MATRLAIISDTHLPQGARRLPEACVARLRAADRRRQPVHTMGEAIIDADGPRFGLVELGG